MTEVFIPVIEHAAEAVRRGRQFRLLSSHLVVTVGSRLGLRILDTSEREIGVVPAVLTEARPVMLHWLELAGWPSSRSVGLFGTEDAEDPIQSKRSEIGVLVDGVQVKPWQQRTLSRDLGFENTAQLIEFVKSKMQLRPLEAWHGYLLTWKVIAGRCKYDTAGEGDCERCASRGGCVRNGGPYVD